MTKDILMKEIFGEHYSLIDWFLQEWRPGDEVGDGVVINNIDDFINWMKTEKDIDLKCKAQ